MRILVTGAAGFIGFHLSLRFLEQGHSVTGLDNLNDYYSVELKKSRLDILLQKPGFSFAGQDLADMKALDRLFAENGFDYVVNLAAQPGVRYSLINPSSYVQTNLVGFANLLEACRHHPVKHLVFASSSSVYGLNRSMPFSERDNVDHPVSLYAASKKSGELMAHAYSHLFNLPCTGLRFFTVYGPWGRPDMALFMFTKAILEGRPIDVFNHGRLQRDFTYIDDIVEGVARLTEIIPQPDPDWRGEAPNPASSPAPWRVYNIGNNNMVELGHFIEVLEKTLGRTAQKNMLPMQPGDVHATCADIDSLQAVCGFTPRTTIEEGIPRFVEWYKSYYGA